MSARLLLAGFAKSVLVHRHAFVPSPTAALEIGRTAGFPDSFREAFGAGAPKRADAAIAAGRWSAALKELDAWARREPGRAEPRVIAGVILLWAAPGAKVRPGRLDGMIDRYAAPAGIRTFCGARRGTFPRGLRGACGWRWLSCAVPTCPRLGSNSTPWPRGAVIGRGPS